MKKRWMLVLIILLCGLVSCGEEKPPVNVAPGVETTVQQTPDHTEEPDAVVENVIEFPLLLKVGEEFPIDLDGDGEVERVLVEVVQDDLGWNRHTVTINGVDCTDAMEFCLENPDPEYYAVVDLDAGDQWLEIALPYEGPSNDPDTLFLRYEEETLTSLGVVYGMVNNDELTFEGAGVISSSFRLDVLQTWFAPVQWAIGESGSFEIIPQELYYPYDDIYLQPTKTAVKELAGYPDRNSKELRNCIGIGTKFMLIATDNISWVLCQDENGEEFWLHLDEETGFRVELFDGSYVWDGIEGLSMAD